MRGKELLKNFRNLSEAEQNKILVNAFVQIAKAHKDGYALANFCWCNCELDDGAISISVSSHEPLTERSKTRNLRDYAALIYSLATGKSNAEAMNWDGGRKIKSAVLREIVLTLGGRNNSIEPLIRKLQEAYIDEDEFFEGYTTVDEKEASEAYERQRHIDTQRRMQEHQDAREVTNKQIHPTQSKSWPERIGIYLLMGLSRILKGV